DYGVRRAEATLAIRDYFVGLERAAGIYRNADAGDRRCRADEHDVSFGNPAHPRDWSGEGAGSASTGHIVSISDGGDGNYGGGRRAGDCPIVCGLSFGGTPDVIQRDGETCGGGRRKADCFADDSVGGDGDISGGGRGERHGASDARSETGSD